MFFFPSELFLLWIYLYCGLLAFIIYCFFIVLGFKSLHSLGLRPAIAMRDWKNIFPSEFWMIERLALLSCIFLGFASGERLYPLKPCHFLRILEPDLVCHMSLLTPLIKWLRTSVHVKEKLKGKVLCTLFKCKCIL